MPTMGKNEIRHLDIQELNIYLKHFAKNNSAYSMSRKASTW